MAAPGQETTASEEGEDMGNNGTSFTIVLGVGGKGLIQATQGQWQSVAAQQRGVQ
jgi:hypothetical protein